MPTANNKCFFTGATDIEDIHIKPIYDMPEKIPPPLPPHLYENDEPEEIPPPLPPRLYEDDEISSI